MISSLRSILVRIAGSSRGFSLPELLVSIAIMSLALGLIGGGIFQALGIERFWSDNVIATKELRHGASWFAEDALNAQATDLSDGQAATSSATITWTDYADVSHSAAYTLVGDQLFRNFDGDQIVVARRVVSAGFSRSGSTLKLTITVDAAQGTIESTELEVYARMLQ